MKPHTPQRLFSSILVHAVLLTASLLTLIPIAWMICASFKGNEDFFSSLFLPIEGGRVAWDRLTFSHYIRLFTDLDFPRAMLNSVFFASVGSVIGTLCCAMGGFALSKYNFRFRGPITVLVLGALVLPGPLLMAPGYQWIHSLGLLNTFGGLLLPGMVSAFGVFLFRQSMLNTLPPSLLEAARMDGCGEIRLFFTIVLPLVKPTIGAFLLITFLGNWNNFIWPQIILQSPEKYPLSVAIAQLKGMYSMDYGMLMAGMVVSVLPVVILFLFLQKEFVAGLTEGGVKG